MPHKSYFLPLSPRIPSSARHFKQKKNVILLFALRFLWFFFLMCFSELLKSTFFGVDQRLRRLFSKLLSLTELQSFILNPTKQIQTDRSNFRDRERRKSISAGNKLGVTAPVFALRPTGGVRGLPVGQCPHSAEL